MRKYANVATRQCVGCGSCKNACPREAITIPDGIYARADVEKCVGCGLCAKACPASIIEIMVRQEDAAV